MTGSCNVTNEAVTIMQASSGLTSEEAKLAVYYATATWRMVEFALFPILRLCGPPGTGKTSAMETVKPLCCKPRSISAKEITPAALRDELARAKFGTALIEEADETRSPRECEQILAARCSPSTGELVVKVKYGNDWRDVRKRLYGATVVHYRSAFTDQAIDSRSITIETRYRDGKYTLPATPTELRDQLQGLSEAIDLAEVANLGSGRIPDIWRPMLAVAKFVADDQWLEWAKGQMRQQIEDLRDGHAYELAGLMLARIVEALTDEDKNEIICRQLRVGADITAPLLREQRIHITPWQANRQLRELGFVLERAGGCQKFTPTKESLRRAAQKIGYNDALLVEQLPF